MLQPWMLLAGAAALAGCASKPIELPPPAPAPSTEAPDEPAVVEAPTQPDQPPPPPPEPTLTKPAQVDGGPYRVCVASEPAAKDTESWVKRLEADGLRAQVEPAEVGGKTWQRVVVPGLRNGREAREMAAYLNQQLGMQGAWVIPKQTPPPAPAAARAPAEPAAAPAPAAAAPAPAEEHPQN